MATFSAHLWDYAVHPQQRLADLQQWVVQARTLLPGHTLSAVDSICRTAEDIPNLRDEFLTNCDLNIVLLHTTPNVRTRFRARLSETGIPFALFHFSRSEVPRHACANPNAILVLEEVVDEKWILAVGKREWWRVKLDQIQSQVHRGGGNG